MIGMGTRLRLSARRIPVIRAVRAITHIGIMKNE